MVSLQSISGVIAEESVVQDRGLTGASDATSSARTHPSGVPRAWLPHPEADDGRSSRSEPPGFRVPRLQLDAQLHGQQEHPKQRVARVGRVDAALHCTLRVICGGCRCQRELIPRPAGVRRPRMVRGWGWIDSSPSSQKSIIAILISSLLRFPLPLSWPANGRYICLPGDRLCFGREQGPTLCY